MIAAVADTHAEIWYLFNDTRLSLRAREFISHAVRSGNTIVVSAISMAEIVYLIEKNRLPLTPYTDLRKALADPGDVLKEAPFTAAIVDAMRQIGRAAVPDLPDRAVAATVFYLNIPIIRRDARIESSNLQTIW
jgi:PIN domain nuclease of toxin-antitoxin system